jgi:CDP-glucose 4,6-dehydratase
MTKNILVTGATGFIGSHLIDHLSQNPNNKIYGLSRSIKHESTFNALNLDQRNNVNIIFGNVNSYHVIEEIIATYDIDQIYHLAAKVIVREASKAPLSTLDINVNGTINILEATRIMPHQIGKYISTIVMSTDKVYGLDNKLPYHEDQPIDGSDIYSVSKSCEDIIARGYAYNYDLPIVVARPANTYGEYDFNWSRLVPTLARTFLDKDNQIYTDKPNKNNDKELILNKGSYHYIREFNYVKDTVAALTSLIDNIDKTKGHAYNIGSGEKCTTEELVNKFIRIAYKYVSTYISIKFKDKEKTFKEIPEQYLDCTKIKETTGWRHEYTLESGLEETIKKYKFYFLGE